MTDHIANNPPKKTNPKKKSKKKIAQQRKQFADIYINSHHNYFNASDLSVIQDKLIHLPKSQQTIIQTMPLKNPILALILSLFFGTLGIDRFYLGNIGLGVGKLLTLGGLGIWTVIDWFLIMKAARDLNYEQIMTAIKEN